MSGYGDGGYGEEEYGGSGAEEGDENVIVPSREPWNGTPHPIPGRIQAEHFDIGGEGVTFHETDAPASWALDFRSETGVDFKRAPGTDADISVGRFRPEEWLEYTTTIESGVYTVRFRGGTANSGAELVVSIDGEELTRLAYPETGWSSHDVVETTDLPIQSHADTHTLRISPAGADGDVDWIEFERTGDITMTETATITLTLEAQHELTVHVTDGEEPLEGAVVTVEATDGTTDTLDATTDETGEAVFSAVPETELTVGASLVGYDSATATVAPDDFQ